MSLFLTGAFFALIGTSAPQDAQPSQHARSEPIAAEINQLAERQCADIDNGQTFDHGTGDEVVRWLARDMPRPKDDYDTEEGFRQRFTTGVNELISTSPVFVVSIKLSVARHNSTYNPHTGELTFRTGEQIECAREGVSFCLRPGYYESSEDFLFAIHAADNSLAQRFPMPPDTARYIRENDRHITAFIVASLEQPYRTQMRYSLEYKTVYHLHAHCISYTWSDPT